MASKLWKTGGIPDWVVVSSAESKTTNKGSIDYILSDTQVNLANQQPQFFYNFSYHVNDVRGVEENSDLRISFNPDFQTVIFHNARLIRDGKTIQQLSPDLVRMIDIEPEQTNKIYSGYKQLTLWLKGVAPGDTVDYSYSIIGANPVFAGYTSYFFDLGWSIPVEHLNVRVLTTPETDLHFRLGNTDSKLTENTIGNFKEYQLSIQNTLAILKDGDNPSWEVIYPYLQISDYSSWKELSHWADSLFDFALNEAWSEELMKVAQELRSLPPKEAIESAIKLAQEQIRYLGVEIADNSHRPHTPSQVYANRYGDCKDKAVLLVALLRHLNIEAAPALVSMQFEQTLDQYLPSHNLFDHAIAWFKFEGKEYWIDATVTHQGQKLENIAQADFGAALLVMKNTSNPVRIPEAYQSKGTIDIEQRYQASDYVSPVDWIIESTYSGRQAERMRYRLSGRGVDRLSTQYFDYYAKQYTGLEMVEKLIVNDHPEKNQLTIREHYLRPDFWSIDEEEGTSSFSLYSDVVDSYLSLPDKVQRSQHLYLFGPVEVNQRTALLLPEYIDFSHYEEQREFEDEFIFFDQHFKSEYRKLVLSNSYRSKARSIPPGKTASHLSLLRDARKYLNTSKLVTGIKEPSTQSMHVLVQYIQNQRYGANVR